VHAVPERDDTAAAEHDVSRDRLSRAGRIDRRQRWHEWRHRHLYRGELSASTKRLHLGERLQRAIVSGDRLQPT
jgi:hypothetical protein